MASSILNTITGMLSSNEISKLSGRLGESESALSSGITSTVAAMIGGLAQKADDPSAMRQIFNMATSAPSDVNVSNLIGGVPSSGGATGLASSAMDAGGGLLSMIFGDRQNAVGDVIARTAGLSGGAVRQLMTIAAPLLLSVLGRRVREGGLTASSLRSDLLGEASTVRNLIPTGLAGMLGSATQAMGDVSSAAVAGAQRATRSASRLWPVFAIVALLLGAGWAISRYRSGYAERAQVALNATAERMKAGASSLGEFISRRLPGDIELRIPEYGVEGKLLGFIQGSEAAGTERWFDFDRLTFDTNSASLRPESEEQLQNIASILKAYPNVRVKIGGYTDNTGDPEANLRLSQARANSVTAELMRLGISSNRLEAEGYGSQHPVADNSTEEGRARNRRISIRVTEK